MERSVNISRDEDAAENNSLSDQGIDYKLHELVFSQPRLKMVYFKLLFFCASVKTLDEIEKEIMTYPEMEQTVVEPYIILSWLESTGGMMRIVPDENNKASAVQDEMWQSTPAGLKLVMDHEPIKCLMVKMDEMPQYSECFLWMMNYCITHKTLGEINKEFPFDRINNEKIYPSYILSELEDAGAVEWKSDGWKTSETGMHYLAAGI